MDMLSVWTEHPPRITSHQSILASWDMSVLNIGTVQSPLMSFRSSSLGCSRGQELYWKRDCAKVYMDLFVLAKCPVQLARHI